MSEDEETNDRTTDEERSGTTAGENGDQGTAEGDAIGEGDESTTGDGGDESATTDDGNESSTGDDGDSSATTDDGDDADPAETSTGDARVEELEAELDAREARIDELESRLRRAQADFQNYKKRQKKRQEQRAASATEDLVERLLDVRDNLKRALEAEYDDVGALREGVQMTLSEFDRVLDAENVAEIEPDPGTGVDPQRHEVLVRVESELPEGTIAEVYQPGYELGEKVLRAAQVTVSDGNGSVEDESDNESVTPEKEEATEGDSSGGDSGASESGEETRTNDPSDGTTQHQPRSEDETEGTETVGSENRVNESGTPSKD